MPILSAFGAAKAIGVAGRPSVQNYSYDFSSGVVTYPTNAAFAVGSNDFSIECFVYLDAAPAISAPVLDFGFSTTLSSTYNQRVQFYIGSDRRLYFVRNQSTSIQTVSGGNPQISLSTWTYIACSRVSGNLKMFVGSTQVVPSGGTTVGGTIQTAAAPPTIGNGSVQTTRYIDGKISNLRFNVGSGFTSATIPTQPLTADATTKILTCQSSTIKDNSVANSGGPWSVTSSGVSDYFKNTVNPKHNVSLRVTQSWCNYSNPGQYHHKHAHPNSYISGVFYVQTNANDRIYFYRDGWQQIKFPPEQWNPYNSEFWWFEATVGKLILFPSSLTHMVPEVKGDDTRISLSFNTFPVGVVGEEMDLTGLRLEA